MAVETLELSHDTGTILFCTTTDKAFGHRFDASVDVVEDFLTYLRSRALDARTLDAEGILGIAWDDFVEAYSCGVCGTGNVEHDDLDFSACCGTFHCGTHRGDDEWSDTHNGKTTNYGHKC
jgi:hypothetical protein